MMNDCGKLLISNVPVDCDESYLCKWVEARGYRTLSVSLVRDVVSCTSPSFAHVVLMDNARVREAQRALNGQTLKNRLLQVKILRFKHAA